LHIFESDASQTTNPNCQLTIEKNSHCMMQFLAGNGSISGFYFGDDGSAVVGQLYYTHGTESLTFVTDTTTAMIIDSSQDVTIQTGDIVFGTAGKGICLGVTSNTDSNTLDDYEEGTFTPTLAGTTAAGNEPTGSGYYVKVGRIVHAQLRFSNVTVSGAEGSMRIGGFPQTIFDTNSAYGITTNFQSQNIDFNGAKHQAWYTSGAGQLDLLESTDGGDWTDGAVTNSTGIYFNLQITYMVD
jgi:hypothetical protein